MDSNKKPADNEKVTCQACKKSMAADDAITPEASDYYLHFCGLDCYAQWQTAKSRPAKPSKPA